MIETKFRAWDSGTKQMIYNFDKEFNGLKCPSDENRMYVSYLNSEGELTIYDNGVKRSKNLVLMQFTGLKDKEGKEIYEGDILRIKNSPRGYALGEVRFSEGTWQILMDKKCGGYLTLYNQVNNNEVEVIGNIYEIKKLLK